MAADTKSRSRDSVANTLTIAVAVSLICSVLVASAAVLLKPLQDANRERYEQRTILDVAGLYDPDADIDRLFAVVETRLVELSTGDYVGPAIGLDDGTDSAQSVDVPAELDIAGIRRRASRAQVYLVRDGERVQQVILPVYGSGLWSTMYGYLALDGSGRTVRGLHFYEHAETPGLGDQVDRPSWRAQWAGKQVFDDAGTVRLEVVRGQVADGPNARYQVDGLSGATLTGRGVSNLVRYWTGPHGFGPYLEKLAQQANDNE